VSGSEWPEDPGSYGAQHVVDPQNKPPGRTDALGWMGAEGQLWLYGGYGVIVHISDTAEDRIGGSFSDLWRYVR